MPQKGTLFYSKPKVQKVCEGYTEVMFLKRENTVLWFGLQSIACGLLAVLGSARATGAEMKDYV